MKGTQLMVLQQPIMFFLQISAIFILVWIGGMEIVKGHLTPGNFLSFFMGIFLLIDPIVVIGKVYGKIQQGLSAVERIFDILDVAPTVKEKPNAGILDKIQGDVEFRDVCFRYNEKQETVLDKIFIPTSIGATATTGADARERGFIQHDAAPHNGSPGPVTN